MELIDTPANRCPPGANIVGLRASDGAQLRAAFWRPEGVPRGTVALVQGRAEFIEKYYEVVAELLERGFVVASFDWRGQGLSQRLAGNRAKGHLRRSTDYRLDLDAFIRQLLAPDCPKPWFALAHSMGAAAVLDHSAGLRGRRAFRPDRRHRADGRSAWLSGLAHGAAACGRSRRAGAAAPVRAGRRPEDADGEALRRKRPDGRPAPLRPRGGRHPRRAGGRDRRSDHRLDPCRLSSDGSPDRRRLRRAHPHAGPDARGGRREAGLHAGHRGVRAAAQDRVLPGAAGFAPRDPDGARRDPGPVLGGLRRVRARRVLPARGGRGTRRKSSRQRAL